MRGRVASLALSHTATAPSIREMEGAFFFPSAQVRLMISRIPEQARGNTRESTTSGTRPRPAGFIRLHQDDAASPRPRGTETTGGGGAALAQADGDP